MQIALWCGRYAASVVELRWKMERGDIWFSQVHAPDGMNTFEGPSSGAPYTFNRTFFYQLTKYSSFLFISYVCMYTVKNVEDTISNKEF